MPKKPPAPPREQCRCTAFCIEDIARTGRFCKLRHELCAATSKDGLASRLWRLRADNHSGHLAGVKVCAT